MLTGGQAMSDLAKKLHLRALARLSLKRASKINLADAALDREAAAALILANARIARLEEALKPFARAADIKLCGEWKDDEYVGRTDTAFYLTFGDLRRARAALKGDA